MVTESMECVEADNPYSEYGCADRNEYLAQLADENGVDLETVRTLADMLGPNEDFDALVTQIEDIGDGFM